MSYLRRLSTRSLIALVVAVFAVAAGGAAIAVAAGGSGSTPAPKPLDQAIQDALAAKPPDGVTARVTFTNKLFPSGALLGQTASALMSGASGRLWVTGDGRGRIELQSDAGDVQILWDQQTISIYDASSNTVYRADLPSGTTTQSSSGGTVPALADIDKFLTELGDSLGGLGMPSRRTSAGSPPTACRSRRSTTAACSARSSSPGTPSRECPSGSASTRKAAALRCSSSP